MTLTLIVWFVVGVVLESGERLSADIVISDADPAFLYSKMLRRPPLVPRLKLKQAQTSMGLFVLYFGTTRQYPEVAHHTIWFGDRYRELLRDIFHRHRLGPDFSLYVHRPTATDPSFAPAGCDSWYVLAPVPNLSRRPTGPQSRKAMATPLSKRWVRP